MTYRDVYLPQLLPHQADVVDDPSRFKVCCWGRQCGKTCMCSVIALVGHGPRAVSGRPQFPGALYGASIWWVTKDFPTAEKIWRDLKGYLARWGGDLQLSEQKMRVDFPGGGSITIKSAATSNRASGGLRGDTIHGLIMDEAAFCPQETWDAECQPMLARHRGWVVFISTPNGQNWFEEVFLRGGKVPGWRSWHLPSSANPTLHPDELRGIQETVDKYKWAREYLAEFNVQGGVVFERQWFKTYRVEHHMGYEVFQAYDEAREGLVHFGEPIARHGMYVFVTADMAMTVKTASDYTAIMCWGAGYDGRLWALDCYRDKVEWPQIVPKIKAMYDQYGASCLVVEASGPLVRLNAQAREFGMNVEEWAIHQGPLTEKRDKVARNGPAAPHVQAGRVVFPDKAPWLNQFVSECCAFPMGNHDDMVDCLGMAVWHRPPNLPMMSEQPALKDSGPDWGTGIRRPGRSRWE